VVLFTHDSSLAAISGYSGPDTFLALDESAVPHILRLSPCFLPLAPECGQRAGALAPTCQHVFCFCLTGPRVLAAAWWRCWRGINLIYCMAYFAFKLMGNRGGLDYDRDRVVGTDLVQRNCNGLGRKHGNGLELEVILFPVYSSYCCFVDGRGFQDSHPSALEHACAGPGSRIGAKFKTSSHSSCADLRPIFCVCAYTFVWQLALVRNSVR
jgi:hypothetical protein